MWSTDLTLESQLIASLLQTVPCFRTLLGWMVNMVNYVIYEMYQQWKTSQELRKLPSQVKWKVKFEYQICPVCPGFPVSPDMTMMTT